MNALKKLAIATIPTLVLTFGAVGGAMANHDGAALTADEKNTMTLAFEFGDCVGEKLAAVTQKEINAYIEKLIVHGIPDNKAALQPYVQKKFFGESEQACEADMNVDLGELKGSVGVIVKEHGESILRRPAP